MTSEAERQQFKMLAADYGLTLTSETRPGATTKRGTLSDHALGHALDFAGPPDQMVAFARAAAQKYPGDIKQLIHTPVGMFQNGQWQKYSDPDHSNHVHIAWGGTAAGASDLADAQRFKAAYKPSADTASDLEDARAFAQKYQQQQPAAAQRPPNPSIPHEVKTGRVIDPTTGQPFAKPTSFRQNIPRDLATGRVINPDTGQPFPQPGAPVEAPSRSVVDYALEGITPVLEAAQGNLQGGVNRATAGLYPLRDLLNKVAEETGKLSKQYGGFSRVPGSLDPRKDLETQALLKALHRWAPWETLKKGVLKGEPTDLQFFQLLKENDPEFRASLKRAKVPAAVLDFFLSLPADEISGRLQGRVVGALQSAESQGVRVAGRQIVPPLNAQQKLETAIPPLGRAAEARRSYLQANEIYNRGMAGAEEHTRSAADFAEDVRRTSQQALKQGATIRAKDAVAGRTTNRLAELVGDWMEAGSPGAKYPRRQQVLLEAARQRIDAREIERLGLKGQDLADQIGADLVYNGLLSPQAYTSLRGQYLPRLYLLYSQSPEEGEKLLQRLEKQNLIQPDDAGAVRDVLATRARYGGKSHDFTKAREIADYAQRTNPALARIASTEVTPALTRYAQKASREIGEARALEEISRNPNLAVPKAAANPEQLAKWPRMEINGVDHVVHPGVKRLLDLKNSDDALTEAIRRVSPKAARRWRTFNKALRAIWVSSPRTAINNAVGNYELGDSAASTNGAKYSLSGYAEAAKAIRTLRKTGQVTDPLLQEALAKTDILGGSQGLMPRGATAVKGGFGVETAGQKLAAIPGRLYEGYANTAYRDIEQAGRFYLYKELRQAGKDPAEAAKIVRAAMVDYTAVGPLLKFAEQNNVAPFLTFPSKAIFQYVNTAARRPDKFATYTGQRLRTFLDQLADEVAGDQGKKGQAQKNRQAGQTRLSDLPIPGLFDASGQQRYLRAPLASPILQAGPNVAGAGLPEAALERLKSAFPLPRLALELATNRNTFLDRPIVEPGTTPGSLGRPQDMLTDPQVAKAYGMHVARTFFPQATDVERIYHGLTGTTPFMSRSAAKQSLSGALLQAFTGASLPEGAADNAVDHQLRGIDRLKTGKKSWGEFSANYRQAQRSGKVPLRQEYVAYLQRFHSSSDLAPHFFALQKKLPDAITSDYTTGRDHEKLIKDYWDWFAAMRARYKELKHQEAAEAVQP